MTSGPDRKPSVADGLTVCWAVIFTVWCAVTGHMFWWLMSTGPLLGFYVSFRTITRYGGKRGK